MSTKKPASRASSASKNAKTAAAPATASSRTGSAKRKGAVGTPSAPGKSSSQLSLESKSRSGSRTSLKGAEKLVIPHDQAPGNSPLVPSAAPPPDEEVIQPPKVDEQAEYRKRLESLPLPFELLRMGLSNLGRSPDELKQVFTKLSLPNAGLGRIDMLKNYPYIQTLELPGNGISDTSVLSYMRYLVQVDLSNNDLTKALDFNPPPFNLQHVDLSRNKISDISDLSKHRFLMKLCLDRNFISAISGLSQCKYLTHLSLVNNNIGVIEGLENLPLKVLDLRRNRISSLTGLETLLELEELRVGHNSIETFQSLEHLTSLRLLDAEHNQLSELTEVFPPITHLSLLRDLNLNGNPLKTDPAYRLQIVFQLPRLRVLDVLPVSPEEKVAAMNLYSPLPSVVASVQHAAMMKSYGLRQMVLISKVDLMRSSRLRPVVLCGPSGVGKRSLANRLISEHPNLYGAAISHTTRRPRADENDGVDYHFVSRDVMEGMVETGQFIQVVVLFGELYGISVKALDKVTEEDKIAIMCLELDGVLTLKRSPIKCHYICISVPDMLVLQRRLESRFPPPRTRTTPTPVDDEETQEQQQGLDPKSPLHRWLAKAALTDDYIESDTFFDLTITNAVLEDAYRELEAYCLKEHEKVMNEED
ncbi:P-loop containing nucleoside triphosphate hydrolase protein [Powellomyces hirtus]|nr:P-loop containing nucleoside triphosphate hydrolase protein [Powellomyces hirtus]